jgi:hypothetical protein
LKYRRHDPSEWLAEPHAVTLIDHLPGQPEHPLLAGYADWFAGVRQWFAQKIVPRPAGMREVRPGVWVGAGARISPKATLVAPCWIGCETRVGAHAVIGPNAVIEDRCFIDAGCEIADSIVGPETITGRLLQVRNSFAWGTLLINGVTNSWTHVPDTLLMRSLRPDASAVKAGTLFGRALAALAMLLTLPLALIYMLRAKVIGLPAFRCRLAVRPQSTPDQALETLVYYELAEARGWLRRWPQLWSVACGEFAWVGNRPLSPREAGTLSTAFERLWLAAPIGLISHADARRCADQFTDETRAHSSYYSVRANWRLDLDILTRACARPLFRD